MGSQQDLLRSAGNSTQYFIITYIEKNLKKNGYICICITESVCCPPEINAILQVNCTPI